MKSTAQDKTLTVFMADDDDFAVDLMHEAFERTEMPAELVSFRNGQELLDYLAGGSEGDHKFPVLVLLDLNMSGMDGRQTLRELKRNPDFCAIPVVVMSSSNEEPDLTNSYKWGCNSFIKKPPIFKDLVAIVETMKSYWFEAVLRPDQAYNA